MTIIEKGLWTRNKLHLDFWGRKHKHCLFILLQVYVGMGTFAFWYIPVLICSFSFDLTIHYFSMFPNGPFPKSIFETSIINKMQVAT